MWIYHDMRKIVQKVQIVHTDHIIFTNNFAEVQAADALTPGHKAISNQDTDYAT